jgi:putative transposase
VVWAVDFQFDATTDGRPIKIVSIVDEHTRECLGGLVERNITGRHLIDELDRLAVDRGYPAVLRCDNGPELACAAMADWAGELGLHFIPPGQPWRNGYIESFNSRVRDECLNISMFLSLAQARVVISDWKADYNHRRRHSALGYQAPAVYAAARTHPCSSPAGLAFSSPMAAATSPERTVVFAQRGSVSVVDARYLDCVFKAPAMGLMPGSSTAPQEPAEIS